MGTFKQWLELQEITLGSDGVRDNTPTQTANATQQVAASWMGNPKNSQAQGNLIGVGAKSRSALPKQLMGAAAQAIQTGPRNMVAQTNASQVGKALQASLGLPSVLKTPQPSQVRAASI